MNLAKKGKIISVKQIAKRTIEAVIEVPDDFNFRAGQYVWMMIPELKHPDAAGNTRMWSIASSPNRKGELSIIFRTGKSGYKKTLIEMAPGSEIVFSGPYGHIKLSEDKSRPLIFLAGGVGVAPFLSMIRFSTETASGHKIILVNANVSEEEAVYIDELSQIANKNHNFKLIKIFGRLEERIIKTLLDENAGVKPIWHIIGKKEFVNSASKFLADAGILLRDTIFEQNYPDTNAGLAFKKELELATPDPHRYPFMTAVENALFHIVITDTNGQILYANRGAQNLTGYTFEEMKSNTPRLWGGLMPENFYKEFWDVKKYKQQTFSGEIKNRRKNQDEYYALLHASPILNENKELVGFIATEDDITKLKEFEIAKSENHNPRKFFLTLLGAIFGVELLIMFVLGNIPVLPSFIENILDAAMLMIVVYPVLYFYSFKPLVKEINSRRAIEESLKLSESRYRNIFDFSMDGVFLLDPQARIIMTNLAAQKLLGRTAGELVGLHMRDTYPIKDRHLFDQRFAEFQIKRKFSVERELLRQDGTIAIVDILVSQMPDERILLFMRDITERKKAEQKLQEIDRAKSEFISIASHQLRTPVSGLSWLTEALQLNSKNFNKKQKEYLNNLATLSKRLVRLVEDLLNISRIELKTAATTEKSRINISSFIEKFIKEIKSYADLKKHNIVFGKNIKEILTIELNQKLLYSVLQNLASNAIDYSPENTGISINLEKTGNFIKISISNKGPVIPKDERAHLFERFYRGESAKKMKAEGTGLGLYIVKIMIEEMGGNVGFESVEGKDTVFWFTIPLIKTADK